jgi:hypothetical protein
MDRRGRPVAIGMAVIGMAAATLAAGLLADVPAADGAGLSTTASTIGARAADTPQAPESGVFGWVNVDGTPVTRAVTVTNDQSTSTAVASVVLDGGSTGNGFTLADEGSCAGQTVLAPGATCAVDVRFAPTTSGEQTGEMLVDFTDDNGVNVIVSGAGAEGFYLVGADGSAVATEPSNENSLGSGGPYPGYATLPPLNRPIVGAATTPDGNGLWEVASDGGIFSRGDAGFFGSTGALKLNKPIVGMASTPDGGGYWLVASDGGIFAFGDARFFGSTGSLKLNKPIVGMARTSSGSGYWLVASDGGVFNFGDATFYGSLGGTPPPNPVLGLVPTRTGAGYWIFSPGSFVADQTNPPNTPMATTGAYGDAPAVRTTDSSPVAAIAANAGMY